MGSSSRSKQKNQHECRIDHVLLEMAFWVLIAQLLGTAIYFTGTFTNPQTHKEFIAQFGSVVAIGLWFLAQAVRGKVRIRFCAYYLPVLFLLVWSAIRTATSVTPLSTRKWVLVAQVVVALPIWIDLLESPRRRLLLSWAIVLIGCVMAGGALIESFGYYPYPLISEYDRQSIGSFVGHNNPMAAYLLVASIHGIGLLIRSGDRTLSKVFRGMLIFAPLLFVTLKVHPIFRLESGGTWFPLLAALVVLFLSTSLLIQYRDRARSPIVWGFLILFLLLNVYLISRSESRWVWLSHSFAVVLLFLSTGSFVQFRDHIWLKVFQGFLILLLLVNFYLIILSGSRGVWLSLPFAAVMLFLSFRGLRWVRLERRTLLRAGVSVVVCLCVVSAAVVGHHLKLRDSETPTVVDRILDLRNAFSGTYTRVWTMSVLMVAQHPISGVGFGAWPQQYPYFQGEWFTVHPDTQLGLPGVEKHTERAHSEYLQLAAELGLIGLFGLVWLLAVHARETFRFLAAPTWSTSAAVGLVAMTGTLAHALVYFPFHAADSACPFLANWALFVAARGRRDRVLQASGPAVRWVTALAGVFFLLIATRPVSKLVTADVLTGQMWFPLRGERSMYPWECKGGASFWQDRAVEFERNGDTRSALVAQAKAKQALEKSLELNPHYPESRRLYADTRLRLANTTLRTEGKTDLYPEAIEAFEELLRTYVWHGTYHLIAQCATVLWKATGDESYFQKARENHEKGLRVYPLNYPAIADLGKLYHDHGDDQETIKLYYETQARYGSWQGGLVNLLYARGGTAWKSHSVEDANFYLSVACALDGQDAEKRHTLALFYLDQQRPDAVLHVLRQHLRIQPEDVTLPARVFDTWIRHGDPGEARKAAAELLSTIDSGPTFENQARMVLASFLLHGEYAEADEILAQLASEKAAKLANERAVTQWLKGDVLGAMTTWWRRLKAHEGDMDARVGIGGCLGVLLGAGQL